MKDKKHCGVCSQCIDRRFATLAAGFEREDNIGSYVLDIFRDSIPLGDPRTMVESYHRFALTVEPLSEEGLFDHFSELYECVTPGSPIQRAEAEAFVDLLHRHAKTVLQVTEDQIAGAKRELARRELPPDCLIALLSGRVTHAEIPLVGDGGPAEWHSPDYRSVYWDGEWRHLSLNQARVVELLDQAGMPLSQDHILETLEIGSKSLNQVFRDCWAWETLVISPARGLFTLNSPKAH